jgi:hypothetical protein
MAKSAKRSPGDKLGNWILKELIGGGGNGYVWRVSPAAGTGDDRTLKVLKRTSETIFKRFTAEIEALKHAKGIVGIVPLLDEVCLSGCHPQPQVLEFGHAHGRSSARYSIPQVSWDRHSRSAGRSWRHPER